MMSKKPFSLLLLLILVSPILAASPLVGPDRDAGTVQSFPKQNSMTAGELSLDPLSILVYTEFADQNPGEELENTMTAIDNTYGTNYAYSNLINYTLLDTGLPGYDVLLIPEQENADIATMKTVGQAWASTLTDFVNNGGVVVLLDFGNVSAPGLGLHIYNESGLMQIGSVIDQYPGGTLGTMHRHTFGDALCRRIEYQPEPRNNTMAVDITEGTVAVDIYQYLPDLHDPIVVHKIMGKGHVVFAGFDLSDPDTNYENIVGNAIRLPHRVVFDNAQNTEYTWEHPPPQAGGFAGGKFVEDLLDAGFAVSRMDAFDSSFFSASDVVICTLPYWTDDYSAAEIAELDAYVADGGSIFIQSDEGTGGDEIAALANNFGYYFARDSILDTDNLMRYWLEGEIYYTGDDLLSHPITTNVDRVEFYGNDGFSNLPANAERIIVSDWDGTTCWGQGGWYADLLGVDGFTTMAVSKYGSGRVSVVLDKEFMDGIADRDADGVENYLDSDNDVLLLNTIHWLAGIESANDAPLLTALTHTPSSPVNGNPVTVYVNATDADGLANITCLYRDNLGVWQNVSMTPEGGDQYSASIGNFNVSEEKDYYIRAFDSSTDEMESVSSVVYLNGINYFPDTPLLYDPGTTDNDGVFLLNWTASIDADGSIDHYEIQVSNHSQFATTLEIITVYTDDHMMTVFENDTYYFRVRAVDNEGTVGFWCFQQWINVVIIQGPIVSTPVLSPSEPKHGDSVTLSVDLTDQDGVKNVTCYYSINAGPWQNVSMTNQLGDTYNCSLGTYFVDDVVQYYIKAFDNSTSYNPTTTITYSFEILNQPPTEPVLDDPGTTITVSNLLVNWTDGYDLEGGIDHYELQMSSSIDFSVILDQWSVFTTDHLVTGLSDGTYYFRVKTVDDRGAGSPWSNNESVFVDMNGPSISGLVHSPVNPLHGEVVTVSVNVTDPSSIKNVTCFYRVNAGLWLNKSMTIVTGDMYSCDLGTFFADDVVEYYIETFDNTTAYNMANTTVQMFEIVNQPPSDPILANPGSVSYVSYVYVTWTPSSDLEGAIDHYHLQISRFDDFSIVLAEWNETTTNFNITRLDSGVYFIRVRAFDYHNVSSQWSNVESIEVILTAPPPTTTSTTTTTATPTTTVPPNPFDTDILNLILLVFSGGFTIIIIMVVANYFRQRSSRRYQW
ncbi:MAG: fibronectin type III domain-containing protein [Candidatus Thorarchaeota archaeon]